MRNKSYVIFGSMGMAEHVWDAILNGRRGDVVAVVDNHPGAVVRGKTVREISSLHRADFDEIIIATMDYAGAVKRIKEAGFEDAVSVDVFWDPFFLQVEPTTKCNFNCSNCTRNMVTEERRSCNLALSEFEEILNMFPQLKRIQLQGLGEPLINNNIYRMTEICRERGISASLTTNGSLLNESALEKLSGNLDKLVISVDGVDEDSFGAMRSPGVWKRVEANIKSALTFKNRIKIVFNYVVSADNYEICDKIVEFAYETGPSELHIQGVENWTIPGQDGFEESRGYVQKSATATEDISRDLNRWRERLDEKGAALTFTDHSGRNGRCWWPFFGMFVSVDGYTTPCCIRMQPEVWTFGKLSRKLWFSEKYGSFRRSHKPHTNSSSVCIHCPF